MDMQIRGDPGGGIFFLRVCSSPGIIMECRVGLSNAVTHYDSVKRVVPLSFYITAVVSSSISCRSSCSVMLNSSSLPCDHESIVLVRSCRHHYRSDFN